MESFSRFSRLTLGTTLALTALIAGLIAICDGAASKGFLLGGMAGAAGFWQMARSARQFTSIAPHELPYRVYRWAFVRMGMYGIALAIAFTVDRHEYHGLIAAVFGLLVIRVVMTVLGVTVARAKPGKSRE